MADNNRTFNLIGKFDDQITKKLKGINEEIKALNKILAAFGKSTENITKEFTKLSSSFEESGRASSKAFSKMTSSLEDAGKAAGKVRDTVSQIGEGTKGLDGISESLAEAARAAQKAGESVEDIGASAGRANRQADDLVTTLLKANSLVKMGEGLSQGFDRGMGTIVGTAQKTAGLVGKIFKDSMNDEMADIKAAGGIEGSFRLAGYEGSFKDSQKMYKQYDQVVSEMIRQSSAPTAKVVELQRYTLDTIGPLMLAAEGVAKGTAMKNIDPKKITASAKNYGAFLEKAALFSQGTGTAGFRVAAGIEQLVTRGKIDTTIDFFTDNIMLMKNLEAAGFMGRRGGSGSGKMMTATDAQRMAAMMDAFNKSMSGESTKAMATSLTGSLQGLTDTIMNPSVGILGMSVTFTKDEQIRANAAVNKIQNARIEAYNDELKGVKTTEKRKKQLRIEIEQATATRDQLTKDGADEISTPFKAFSYAFSNLIRSLTSALNAIGPVWTGLSLTLIDFTNKVFGPLGKTLMNVASDMRAKDVTQGQGFGRIVGEIFKTIGVIMGDLATMLTNPKGMLGKAQSEFMQGFMEAFKAPGSLEKARQQLERGLWAFVNKLGEILLAVLTSREMRPFVLGAIALAFGPPLVSAIIAGSVPLIMSAMMKIATGIATRGLAAAAISGGAATGAGGTGAAAGAGVVAGGVGMSAIAVGASVAALAAALIIFQGPILAFSSMLEQIGSDMSKSTDLLSSSVGWVVQGIGEFLSGITNFFAGMWDVVSGLFTGDTDKVVAGIKRIFSGLVQMFTGIGRSVIGLGGVIYSAVDNLLKVVAEIIRRAANKFDIFNLIPDSPSGTKPKSSPNAYTPIGTVSASPASSPTSAFAVKPKSAFGMAQGSPGTQFSNLGGALTYEMSNKPSGSGLVVANSSETIIPAAGGLGMEQIINVIVSGFSSISEKISLGSQAQVLETQKMSASMQAGYQNLSAMISRSITVNEAGFSNMTSKIAAISAGGMSGGLGSGSVGGGVDMFTGMAAGAGLQLTSGYRPGDPGWHGANRARDYSNGTGPTPQMMQFARAIAAQYGSNLKELIYTPLGFSIKNGARVAPYAQGAHYNHVHVAYGLGQGNPAFFNNQSDAAKWESKMMPAGASVRSITSNTSEGYSGMTINAPITIHQQPGQNSEQLALAVAKHLSDAITHARSTAIQG